MFGGYLCGIAKTSQGGFLGHRTVAQYLQKVSSSRLYVPHLNRSCIVLSWLYSYFACFVSLCVVFYCLNVPWFAKICWRLKQRFAQSCPMLYAEANVRWLTTIKTWAENVSLFISAYVLVLVILHIAVDCYVTVPETWRDAVRTCRKCRPSGTRHPRL